MAYSFQPCGYIRRDKSDEPTGEDDLVSWYMSVRDTKARMGLSSPVKKGRKID